MGSEISKLEEITEVEELSNKIKLLFGFCATLLPHIELLEKAEEQSISRQSLSLSAAPILGAFGMDFQERHDEWELRSKRTTALLNLLKVLRDTENDRENRQRLNVKTENDRAMFINLFK